jgi:hypothetical protein
MAYDHDEILAADVSEDVLPLDGETPDEFREAWDAYIAEDGD